MTLNGVMAVTLRYFTEFGKPVFQHITASICGGNLCTSLLYFVVRVRCRRKESSCSLSHLLSSFLLMHACSSSCWACKRCNTDDTLNFSITFIKRTYILQWWIGKYLNFSRRANFLSKSVIDAQSIVESSCSFTVFVCFWPRRQLHV